MTFVPPSNQGGYIQPPIQIDPNQLAVNAFASIQAQFPGWRPIPGALDVAVIEECALMVSVAAAAGTQTPAVIFQFFGLLVGITPIQGVPATVAATITMVDDVGYTIPAGSIFAYILGDAQTLFTVQTTVIIATGDTTGTCTLVCESVGSFPNGLPGTTFAQVTSFAQIASVISTAAVAGGVDAETATDYMNRLSAELQLLTPRPILTADFAALAPNVPGVFRALAIDGLNPGRTVTDGVTSASSPTVTSATLNATDADLFRPISCAGKIPSSSYIGVINSPTSIGLSSSNTVNTPVNATAAGTAETLVLADMTSQERCVTVAGVDDTGAALSSGVNSALLAYLQGLREVNFLVFTIAPTFCHIDVTVTCYAEKGIDTGTVQAAVINAIETYLDPATWGGGADLPPTWDATSNVVTYAGIANAIQGAAGVLYILSGDLTINIHGNSPGTVDITMPGDAPLPSLDTLVVVVNPFPG